MVEANLEALPRLNKVMFESGVIDELLYLDMPHERVQFSGLMILEYGKAVQETVFEQCRVVREGKLRIVFTPDLKVSKARLMLTWLINLVKLMFMIHNIFRYFLGSFVHVNMKNFCLGIWLLLR